MKGLVPSLACVRSLACLLAAIVAAPAAAIAAAPPKLDTAAIYDAKCQKCHGPEGEAPQKGAGLSFADGEWKHGTDLKTIAAIIADGVPDTAMRPFKDQLTAREIQLLARYVRSLDKRSKK